MKMIQHNEVAIANEKQLHDTSVLKEGRTRLIHRVSRLNNPIGTCAMRLIEALIGLIEVAPKDVILILVQHSYR